MFEKINVVFFFFRFILWSAGTTKSTILQIFLFFIDYYKVWTSDRDYVIRLYAKVQ